MIKAIIIFVITFIALILLLIFSCKSINNKHEKDFEDYEKGIHDRLSYAELVKEKERLDLK